MSNSLNSAKNIKNPLFSASVTGATVEDFTQNAILLTADRTSQNNDHPEISSSVTPSKTEQLKLEPNSEIPLVENKTEENPSKNIFSSFFANTTATDNFFTPISNTSSSIASSFQPPVIESTLTYQENIFQNPSVHSVQTSTPSSNLLVSENQGAVKEILSSPLNPPFSSPSILNAPAHLPEPTLTSFYSSHNQTIEKSLPSESPTLNFSSTSSVPLYPNFQPPIHNNVTPGNDPLKPPQSAGTKNAYRRPGLKRPVYVQVPGLLSTRQSSFPPAITAPTNSETTFQSFHPTSESPSYIPSNTSSVLSDSFSHGGQTRTPILTPSPFMENISSTSSPVMAAMPLEEIQQAENITFATNTILNESDNLRNKGFTAGYRPVYHHWFYKREIEGKTIWTAFSMSDSLKLEAAFTSHDISPDKVVATDGGRYDVNILRRERYPVYWDNPPSEVKRCSWFFKLQTESHYVPYDENLATMLEEEYKTAHESNAWNRKIDLPNGDTIILHGPDVIVFVSPNQVTDNWNNSVMQARQKTIKRGMDEFDIDEGESEEIDHLLFLVHGVGAGCDLKFRSVEEVVDDFRSIALQLVRSHYKTSCENGLANRIEVLPIKWHGRLHSDETGIDKKLKSITLESIPRLRDFTNNTLLDILFYTSPVYCQTIISTVGNELNRLYDLFKERNPSFHGGVSVGGHSLGSLILFDLLSHQYFEPEKEPSPIDEDVVPPLKPHPVNRKINRRISYMMSAAGTGQPQLIYPHISFHPTAFFALGSPIGMFVTVRGLDHLGEDFALPTCPAFFNIFHPYDPVAYRLESLINPQLADLKPVLIPHHKGRKRMHLELKETMVRVGADLKQKLIDSMKSTFNTFFPLSYFNKQENRPLLEAEVDKVIETEIGQKTSQAVFEDTGEEQSTNLSLGILNKGRRIDYVLQEAPFEFIDYLFALTSHVCYWESEDTMLLILKEIYGSMNITTDNRIPQQSMTIERPQSSSPSVRSNVVEKPQTPIIQEMGMDPTVPITPKTNIEPPPISGFVKKS